MRFELFEISFTLLADPEAYTRRAAELARLTLRRFCLSLDVNDQKLLNYTLRVDNETLGLVDLQAAEGTIGRDIIREGAGPRHPTPRGPRETRFFV